MGYLCVDRDICGYCGACVSVCPTNAVELVDIHLRRNESLCIKCRACVKICPVGAMKEDAQNNVSHAEDVEYQVHRGSSYSFRPLQNHELRLYS